MCGSVTCLNGGVCNGAGDACDCTSTGYEGATCADGKIKILNEPNYTKSVFRIMSLQ